MIVGSQKPFDEIWEMVKPFGKVLVLGCNTCVAVCHAGGSKEAEILASLLRMKATGENEGMEVMHASVERQCEHEFFKPIMDEIDASSVVLSLACGVGVNFLSAKTEVPVYPGLNTLFFGAVERPGVFRELCRGCGKCILHYTGGICPIARCAKSLLNGPCGGTNKGKCEINKNLDCAWFLIVEKMKKLGRLEKLLEIQQPNDWSSSFHGGPRSVTVGHIAGEGGKEAESPEESR
jgi:ferredoxin